MNLRSLTLILALLVASQAGAAEIVLHEWASVAGPMLMLGDIANIQATTPARVNELKTTPLMPAPSKGQTRFLRAAQVRDLLQSRGLSLVGLHLKGAATVEVGHSVDLQVSQQVGLGQQVTLADAEARAEEAILGYLTQLTGHQNWEVRVVSGRELRTKLAALGADLSVRSDRTHTRRSEWNGRQRFEISGLGQAIVTTFAQVQRLEMAVVSTRPIARGNLIRRSDIELKAYAGRLPQGAITSVDQAIGKEARQALRPEAVIVSGQLAVPKLVERGETVTVYARTGGIVVRTFAVAEQAGGAGDLIRVKTVDGKQRYAARVSNRGELEVLAIGVNAADLALKSQTTVRR